MFSRGLIVFAVILWAGITGALLLRAKPPAPLDPTPTADVSSLALTQNASPPANPNALVGLPFRSVTLELQRTDWIDRYITSIDEIAALGADTVMFVVDPRQEHGESNRIYLDMRMTPTPEALSKLIKHAKSKNLRVILMPIVLLDAPRKDTEWRGTIKPTDWKDWWQSYTDMITHFAWIAQGNDVDLLVVGSELVSTEKQPEKWREVIAKVREVYKGKLTYSSNWDHYTAVSFWDALDMIGMNSYWALDGGKREKASVGDIREAWGEIQGDLLPFAAKQGKPIMFLEAGWCSLANAASEPWDYTQISEALDLDLQKRLFEGYFQSWYGNPQLGGFSVWEWSVDKGGLKDKSYTPKGKPAEAVLKEYFGKPVWKLDPSHSMAKPKGRAGR